MDEIKDCLPDVEAKKYFLSLRKRSLQSSDESHRQVLDLMRATFGHRGTLGSGHQIAQEWKLTEDKIDHLAKAYLDDALKTIQLYRIPLTQQLCDCFGASYATHARRIVCERVSTLRGATALRSPKGVGRPSEDGWIRDALRR